MTEKQGIQPRQSSKPRRPFPLSITLASAAIGAAVLVTAFWHAARWSVAFGDALLIEAGLCFALAWFAYLKKDGIRILPRKRGASASESWKDRVPGVGEEPSPPSPMPSPEGPRGEEYERLAEAEEALRRKILGEVDDAGGSVGREGRMTPSGGATANLLAAGGILLALALAFEYLVPALIK